MLVDRACLFPTKLKSHYAVFFYPFFSLFYNYHPMRSIDPGILMIQCHVHFQAIMAPKDEQWIPKLIRPPEKDPEGRTFFDWNDEKLKKWKADAIKMQEAHVRDNSRTEWFEYKPEERDAIELRILVTLYGIRTPVVCVFPVLSNIVCLKF